MAATKQQAVVDKEGTGAALNISLHPLVILNISDHFTRQKVLAPKNSVPRVIGVLFGLQSGRNIEITNSYELLHTEVEGATIIDIDFLNSKQSQYKEVFPNGDLLGWYSTGSECKTSDLKIHQQFVAFNESPLYLLLDTVACAVARELPIYIYESELRIVDGEPVNFFSKVSNFRIEPEVAERIAVDHVAHTTTAGSGSEGSQLPTQLAGMQNAIKMLNMRLKIIKAYLESTQKGELPKDHALLRQTVGIINLIPAIDTPKFKEEFLNEYNDALLVTYLSSITKGANVMNDLVDRYNLAYDKQNRRSRGLGFY
eukprot:TRINITY_DN294_c0_g3_i1.p1 TRINITY_DN294_c0_g3~~TRINITY_DN294_c0_g3_i1.p1  ORF type:complete len:313 (-),score=78.97 TRINITY_DN294_c0_g3_i1:79-1017(-)